MALLGNQEGFTFDLMGMILGVISSILFALYIIGSKSSNASPLLSSLMISLGCSLSSFIFALLNQTFAFPTHLDLWINILAIGIFCTALPVLFLFEGLKHISAEKAAILTVLEPVFVVIVGVLLLKEKISHLQCLGIIVVLSGALITLLSPDTRKRYLSKIGLGG
jgi:drug/metabolite transporter (DMT)-like permease